MSIAAGSRLGAYEIRGPLGAGRIDVAPEEMRGQIVDHRSGIFATGAILNGPAGLNALR
jgi:hypothetical protein